MIKQMIGSKNQIEYREKMEDDPRQRKPDITVANKELNWYPKISMIDGLHRTITYFQEELRKNSFISDDLEAKSAKSDEQKIDHTEF